MSQDTKPKRWVKGMPSPNPAGRPPLSLSLSDLARKRVDKQELLDVFLAIARGEPLVRTLDTATGIPTPAANAPEGARVTEVIWPSTAERLRAAEFLWEKIEPPVKQSKLTIEQSKGSGGFDPSKLSDEDLDKYLELQEKARRVVDAVDAEFEDHPESAPTPAPTPALTAGPEEPKEEE